MIRERNLTVRVERLDRPILAGTQEHIQALWAHLLSNAIRYTPPGGRITVSLREDSRERKIIGTVADTGIGISAEEIPRVFEEFYRTKEAKAMQETGTGLGLTIVQQIVSLYGGTVEIDSTAGQGSSFRFILSPSATFTGGSPMRKLGIGNFWRATAKGVDRLLRPGGRPHHRAGHDWSLPG